MSVSSKLGASSTVSTSSTFYPIITMLTSTMSATTATATYPTASSSVPTATSTGIPGSPTTRDFSGPWFRTSWILSLAIGLGSLLWFATLRTRWKRVYAGRAVLRARGERTGAHERRREQAAKLQLQQSSSRAGSRDRDAAAAMATTTLAQEASDDRQSQRQRQEEDDVARDAWRDTTITGGNSGSASPTPALSPSPDDPAILITDGHPGFLGWILPTIRVPDSVMLQTVGLDAVVFLDFLKTSFRFFAICAATAVLVLMPINLTRHGSTDSEEPGDGDDDDDDDDRHRGDVQRALRFLVRRALPINGTAPLPPPAQPAPTNGRSLSDLFADPDTNNTIHLLFTYFFSLLALYMLHKNFHRFLAARQSYALARKETVPARTVLVSDIPRELRGEHELKEYFEKECGWRVDPIEGVRIVREVGKELRDALKDRQEALRGLEQAWWKYRGDKDQGKIRLEGEDANGAGSGPGEDRVTAAADDSGLDSSRSAPTFSAKDSTATSALGQASQTQPPANTRTTSSFVPDDWEAAPNWGDLRPSTIPAMTNDPPSVSELADEPPAEAMMEAPLLQVDDPASGTASPSKGSRSDRPSKRVPTSRFQKALPFVGEKVDALDYWQDRFDAADAEVRVLRKTHGGPDAEDEAAAEEEASSRGRSRLEEARSLEHVDLESGHKEWRATGEAFVTFASISHAEMAAQVVHFPKHSQCRTRLAPDPEDIVWPNMGMSPRERMARQVFAQLVMLLGLAFWGVPVAALASLLSFQEIKRVFPWLAKLIERSPTVEALVQTTFPSTAIIIFNAALPYLLEWLCYHQGFRSKSQIANSILKKYTLFLLFSVLLIFLLANTIWSLLDLAGSPQTIPERLAKSLTQYNARAFSMSYVMLQGIGIMPFQLVNIGSLFFICVYRALFNLTPRELDALYAPPAINYGMIYPPAILIFIVTLVYSVLSPLILLFGAVYFGFAYVVYKYKLINVFVNPYESTGEAWPITFARLVWGIVLFQLFMTGLFAARTSVFASTGMIPLLLGTVVWSWIKREDLKGLSSHTPLAYIAGDSDFSPESRSRDEQREQAVGYDHTEAQDLHYRRTAVYCQRELSEKLPKPWIPAM